MMHNGGVGKHQAELLEKYLSCSLLPWGPGRHPGLHDASWGLVLSASRMQPLSDRTSPSWLETGALLLQAMSHRSLSWLAFGKTAGRKGKGKEANNKCSLLSSSCPSIGASYPAARSTTALPALSCMELSLLLHKHPQTQAHSGILGAVLCRARTSVILPTQDILWFFIFPNYFLTPSLALCS